MKSMTAQARADMLLREPVSRVIPRLAIPTIISMLVTNIYNMADTFFVSQIGTSASGAVGVIFSAMGIIQAVAFTIGMGSGTNVSQALGAGDEERAQRFVSVAFFTAFAVGVVLAALGLANLDALVRFLGATETIAPYARDYATYILYAAPFMMCSFVMNNHLRFEGLAAYAMVGITTGGLLNILLDPLLIFGLGLGTAGAAIATAISQLVSFTILLLMTTLRADAISIRRQGIASISTILLNTTAGAYGDAAIAAMSIVSRFVLFINSSVIGFGQGFQPVCGFCYGAGRYRRVREAFWFCVKVATAILLVLGGISMIFSGSIITAFRRDDAEVIAIGTLALRLQLVTLPLWGFIVMSNMFTQSIGYGVRATIISISRQGLFLIPALLILPRLFGLTGIQCAAPISDLCAFALSLGVVLSILRRFEQMPDREEMPRTR